MASSYAEKQVPESPGSEKRHFGLAVGEVPAVIDWSFQTIETMDAKKPWHMCPISSFLISYLAPKFWA